MKTPIKQRYPAELAEKLEDIKDEIRERMENPDFDFMEVEEIFEEFGLEADYIFEVLNEIV
jgi:Holliday junction resolvasome RuvABC endonuclease subunit